MAPLKWLKRLLGVAGHAEQPRQKRDRAAADDEADGDDADDEDDDDDDDDADEDDEDDDDEDDADDDDADADDDADDGDDNEDGLSRASARSDREIEDAARALFDAGDGGAGIALLGERAVMLARHEEDGLPCLCRRCLRPELDRTKSEGIEFARDFVVSRHRVFFYWMPTELLAAAKQVRASMRSRVKQRLRERRLKLDEPRRRINPFTREQVVIPAREGPRVNPFTGKVIR